VAGDEVSDDDRMACGRKNMSRTDGAVLVGLEAHLLALGGPNKNIPDELAIVLLDLFNQ
jgi:hypothetical protein